MRPSSHLRQNATWARHPIRHLLEGRGRLRGRRRACRTWPGRSKATGEPTRNPTSASAGIERPKPMKIARPLLALAAAASLAWPSAAAAHANLVRSQPADGAVLDRAPKEVRLDFDDTVRPAGGAKAVRNGDGSVLGGKERRLG